MNMGNTQVMITPFSPNMHLEKVVDVSIPKQKLFNAGIEEPSCDACHLNGMGRSTVPGDVPVSSCEKTYFLLQHKPDGVVEDGIN